MPLAPATEAEIEALAARYGSPHRIAVTLEGTPFSPLTKDDRIGEVCMVIRRPSGRLLTARKEFYPAEAFRLLTGGIGHGEPIEAALSREVAEETGLDVAVRRFLAAITYRLLDHPDDAPDFATFAFLLDETGGTLAVADPHERIDSFREVAPSDLLHLAERLDNLPDEADPEIEGRWRDWGRFRAVVHRAVHVALLEPSSDRSRH
jgi:8-oxo-dGTP pyrophosphatase MutT (NUDIX family)